MHPTRALPSLRQRLASAFPGIARRLSSPTARKIGRWALWAFWFVYFGFIALVLVLRYSILPNIETHRPAIERLASQALGQTVGIGRIEASWDGINPDLNLFDVRVHDAEGRPALTFSHVEAILSWLSVPSGKLKLRLLRIDQPTLNLRRDPNGRFFVAGIPLSDDADQADGPGFSDWLFAQRRIRIQNATLIWEDELRQAPALRLEALDFGLDNFGWRRRFGLTAQPPAELASRIDIRGDFSGNDIDHLEDWTGTAFAEIDYVDLAAWRQWIDYPILLPRGRGALRTWADIERGALKGMTADLLLRDTSIRLGQDLPELDLAQLSGRLAFSLAKNGFVVDGRNIGLAARRQEQAAAADAIEIEPMDFHVIWDTDADGKNTAGSVTANRVDLSGLNRLAAYLPLDVDTRQFLMDYQPQGQLADLSARWKGDAEHWQTYSLKGRFSQLALKAQGDLPGFSGISGSVELNEQGGSAELSTQRSSIDLPRVFAVSLIELDTLNARAKWKIDRDGLAVELPHVEFAGPEAAGSASGTYHKNHKTGDGLGNIDLKAALTRADARAVWRYIPLTVGDETRQWLRDSLISGKASEARLTLKGNLEDFPFPDKNQGQFLVTVKAENVVLDYADGWPRLENIYGNLRFEGEGMLVEAQRATILGAKVSNTRAEIPDLGGDTPVILINGRVAGPTAEFLKFIDRSPVADLIDRFTEGMRASGNGHLDIGLKIPLDEEKLGESRIDGNYRFQNNEVLVDSALPPLRQVNGNVQFSGSDLRLPQISANLFGGPLTIKGGLQKDGRVLIAVNGTANIEQLRKQNDSPLLAHLSGSVPYRGEVRINKRDTDLVIDSPLTGLASTLPAPFNKASDESWPLRFEKRLLAANAPGGKSGAVAADAVRDQLTLSLGEKLAFQAIRRKQTDGFIIERAALGIGRPQPLPDQGFIVGVSAPRVDLDVWRNLFKTGNAGAASQSSEKESTKERAKDSSPAFMPDTISLKTPELHAFGRSLRTVDLSAASSAGQWRFHVDSRQASGDLQWDGRGRGRLLARLKHLTIEPSESEGNGRSAPVAADDALRELPALDIVAEAFQVGERHFGRLELQAVNTGGVWDLNKIQLSNPHGALTGKGRWLLTPGQNRTYLDFKVESDDVGKLLDRLGYAGVVSGATAKLEGQIGWQGAPTDFDFASLDGEMVLDATRGQFLKVKPGAGRLLGLISLQSLPRRITLDFRDVFSEGFGFDSIASKLTLNRGIMRTDRLQIDGPAARVLMSGETDLKNETQRLHVIVQPELGTTAAIGVALVNPVAGVATLLANKLLQNPLNQIFGFAYLVTGTWDNPKVEKLDGQADDGASSPPRLPNLSKPETNDAASRQ